VWESAGGVAAALAGGDACAGARDCEACAAVGGCALPDWVAIVVVVVVVVVDVVVVVVDSLVTVTSMTCVMVVSVVAPSDGGAVMRIGGRRAATSATGTTPNAHRSLRHATGCLRRLLMATRPYVPQPRMSALPTGRSASGAVRASVLIASGPQVRIQAMTDPCAPQTARAGSHGM